MKLNSLFTNEVVTARPSDSLAAIARMMEEHQVGMIVLTEGQRPVGIVTDRDVALALGTRRHGPDALVQDIMTWPVTTLDENDGVFKATQLMRENAIRRLVVVDSAGHMVGIVSLDDLLILLSRELFNLAQGVQPGVMAVR